MIEGIAVCTTMTQRVRRWPHCRDDVSVGVGRGEEEGAMTATFIIVK